ncbi:hypothetical protein GCM10009628_36830 [Paeniglutamicibacter kerguelensis]
MGFRRLGRRWGGRIACPGARGQGIAGRFWPRGPPGGHTAGYKPHARLRRLRAHRHGLRPVAAGRGGERSVIPAGFPG